MSSKKKLLQTSKPWGALLYLYEPPGVLVEVESVRQKGEAVDDKDDGEEGSVLGISQHDIIVLSLHTPHTLTRLCLTPVQSK